LLAINAYLTREANENFATADDGPPQTTDHRRQTLRLPRA